MVKTCLERLYNKGWLKSKTSVWSEADRLCAGQKFFVSYEKSHEISRGVIDPTKVFVDSSMGYDDMLYFSKAKEEFMAAFSAIPLNLRGMIEELILKDKMKQLLTKKEAMEFKKELCLALDCLICHYLKEKRK